jgi:hypothetical protein
VTWGFAGAVIEELIVIRRESGSRTADTGRTSKHIRDQTVRRFGASSAARAGDLNGL